MVNTSLHTRPGAIKLLLVIGFSLVLFILLVIALLGLSSASSFSNKLTQTVQNNNIRTQYANKMRNSSYERINLLHQMVRTVDPFERDALFIKFRERGSVFLEAREKIIQLGLNRESQKLIDLQRKFSSIAGPIQYKVIELLNVGQTENAINILINKVIPAQDNAIKKVDEFIHLQQLYNNNSLLLTNKEFKKSFEIITLLTILSILIAILASGFILKRTNLIFKALYNSELREKVIRENIVDTVVTYNDLGIIKSCNKAVSHVFGYKAENIIGEQITRLVSADDIMHTDIELETSQTDNIVNTSRQITSFHKDGTQIYLNIGISKVIVNNKVLYIAILSDITEQIHAEESLRKLNEDLETRVADRTTELQLANTQLKYQANHDTVTNLPNRIFLNEHLQKTLINARRQNKKTAVFFLDIDGFKNINDTHGHETGDLLLKEIGKKITSSLRLSDVVARVGGDEFIAILDDISNTSPVELIAHKIIDAISTPFNINNNFCNIGVSIGISIYPDDGRDMDTLIKHADQAMYKIKSTGKNNLYFYKKIAGC
ncbi:MAG: hypothetical protein DIZ80_13315 [endosymbiont of Galathealinum brachiosum]|uniref:Diguanylate cyclase n=1 Tax=endosymbiont of Galathealinum brachiosum TaxID=2200906 RepID=A0A370D842_9GAMM|nr:MAG: hypothetical protein DIZ80_13315 [endosymbiont of Galathealinum brachiosum]